MHERDAGPSGFSSLLIAINSHYLCQFGERREFAFDLDKIDVHVGSTSTPLHTSHISCTLAAIAQASASSISHSIEPNWLKAASSTRTAKRRAPDRIPSRSGANGNPKRLRHEDAKAYLPPSCITPWSILFPRLIQQYLPPRQQSAIPLEGHPPSPETK